jgi:hypothetical protein
VSEVVVVRDSTKNRAAVLEKFIMVAQVTGTLLTHSID